MAYIERAITSVLKSRISSSKCLLLTGARQVGKGTCFVYAYAQNGICAKIRVTVKAK